MRVDFITNIAPHYRSSLWRSLVEDEKIKPFFIFSEGKSSSIKPIDFKASPWLGNQSCLKRIRNVYLKNVLIWQRGVISHVWKTDAKVVVLLGQMYILSNWLVAITAKSRGIKVVFWGHGAYGREGAFKKWSLLRFLSLADMVLVYGEWAKKKLTEIGHDFDKIRVVYNSLNHVEHMKLRKLLVDPLFYQRQGWFENGTAPTLLFVGRLTKQKSLENLIEAVINLLSRGYIFNVILVGDGGSRQHLEEMSKQISGQVFFYGACYDEQALGRLIANADLCVSPGEVGLTAIHALSFGTPVCTHNAMEFQMPEAEAIIPGKTGILFSREAMDICNSILLWFKHHADREAVREQCYNIIDEKWNTETQARIIRDSILDVALDNK